MHVSVAAQNGSAIATVADTGRGIAAEDLSRVFERFYRGDPARANALGGAGLGLSICKAIVESHGGKITVSSEPGQGSTFRLLLPAASGQAESSSLPILSADPERPALCPMRPD